MLMQTVAKFTTAGPDEDDYHVELSAERPKNTELLTLIYSVAQANRKPVSVRIEANTAEGTLKMVGLETVVTGYIACLLMCGLGHIIQEILDCLRRGHRKPLDLLKCLRKKGVDVGIGLLRCAVSCSGGVFGRSEK